MITPIWQNYSIQCLNYYPTSLLFEICMCFDTLIIRATLAPSVSGNFVFAELSNMILDLNYLIER